MTISYEWLCDYLPEKSNPEKLSKILTSIGLEVEQLEQYGHHEKKYPGLIAGQIIELKKHPNADHLFLTRVDIGDNKILKIVCGATNTALLQKVVVAPPGCKISPIGKEPFEIKSTKIRGELSEGMLCAEDEIGISENHDGIIVLPAESIPGMPARLYFDKEPTDWIFEIGLTPNRMDAMSHIGVAKDVCAWMSHHLNKPYKVVLPYQNKFKPDIENIPIDVQVENNLSCPRYSCVSISNVVVSDSPQWLQQKLKAIGLSPINNIVDITNFILHESGQPLHAFDQDAITGNKVIIKNALSGESFTTLDGKERRLHADDLLICNAEKPMCIAGVFGGIESGVQHNTKNIFLESAFFNPESTRKTSTRLGLRTDAAIHFEKGVDISNTVQVLKRAALLIQEIAGGKISAVTDIYPNPKPGIEIELTFRYLKKLTGKNYHPENVKKILESLEFELIKESADALRVSPPFSKMDILIPADVVEEILRIDGLDEVQIPGTITFSPSRNENALSENLIEKLSGFFVANGFNEIVTNSLTNVAYFSEEEIKNAAQPLNSLSNELNILKPNMLPTALEAISFNTKRKMQDIKFFELGKTYCQPGKKYAEAEHFCVYVSGFDVRNDWHASSRQVDLYDVKGFIQAIGDVCGIKKISIENPGIGYFGKRFEMVSNKICLGKMTFVKEDYLKKFDITQPVYFIDFLVEPILEIIKKQTITYSEISKFPTASRDLAILTNEQTSYAQVEDAVLKLGISTLQEVHLFDVFRSEKLGDGKKSYAVNFTFCDAEKTMTDNTIDKTMQQIIQAIELETGSEIRKS